MAWFPDLSSLVGAGFHAAVLQCAAAAAWDSCQTYFGVISDRFAKDTRLRPFTLYIVSLMHNDMTNYSELHAQIACQNLCINPLDPVSYHIKWYL